MRVVRVFTGNDNQSHFEDVDIDLDDLYGDKGSDQQ